MTKARDTPPTYEMPITVENRHIDNLGHVNNIVYLQWIQETAGKHWRHTASEEEQQKFDWVVLRHEIDYLKPAFKGDRLTARTWVAKMEGVKSFRHVEISRGCEVLVKAFTTWVMLDSQTGKVARVPREMAEKFL